VQLGMVGLGRMGANMTERLRKAGHDLKTFDPKVEPRTAASAEELVQQLGTPRSVWLMVPAGIVDSVVKDLAPHLTEGETAATRTTSTTSAAQPSCARSRSTMWTSASAGVSGAESVATA
jgi:6-phosphogluconate dehydrogenase